jgi:hypothetical protein
VLEQATFAYDVVDNPIQIVDGRDPSAWPASFKPSTRSFQYDDLYRLTRVDYSTGNDDWTSPYAAENEERGPPRPAAAAGRTKPSPHVSFAKRVAHQTFAYDALGNTTATDDDAHGFYDRSLGAIANGAASAGPYQLKQAAQSTGGARDGNLAAAYDDAGNLASLSVTREGPCLPKGATCSQRYAYEWDEVGHLARARRWDLRSPGAPTDPLPNRPAAAELRYTYAGDERVLKTAVDVSSSEARRRDRSNSCGRLYTRRRPRRRRARRTRLKRRWRAASVTSRISPVRVAFPVWSINGSPPGRRRACRMETCRAPALRSASVSPRSKGRAASTTTRSRSRLQ